MSKKVPLEAYHAYDRRVYYGAPCSDMEREFQRIKMLEQRMQSADRTACCTYFPVEGKYMVFTNANILENPDLEGPPRELTGCFHVDIQLALIEAIEVLEVPD